MNRLFWDELIHFDELIHELQELPFTSEEQQELIAQIDSLFHHHLLDEILRALPHEEHEHFMSMLSERPDDQGILVYLTKFVPDIDARIKNRGLQVRDIVKKEILDTKRRHLPD